MAKRRKLYSMDTGLGRGNEIAGNLCTTKLAVSCLSSIPGATCREDAAQDHDGSR